MHSAAAAAWAIRSRYVVTAPLSPSMTAGAVPRPAEVPSTYSVSDKAGISTSG